MKWLERGLWYGPAYVLCLDEKALNRAQRQLGTQKHHWHEWPSSYGTTLKYLDVSGDVACIVCLNPSKKASAVEICCVLAHEAVHIWQHHCDEVAEEKPGKEAEAYAIQHILLQLLQSYVDQTKRRRK